MTGDQPQKDPLADCEKEPTASNKPPGMRWVKSVRSVRGGMMICAVHLEIDDPLEAAKSWKTAEPQHDAKMLQFKGFRLERLSDRAYRLSGAIEAPPTHRSTAGAESLRRHVRGRHAQPLSHPDDVGGAHRECDR